MAAIRALEARSREFMREKAEKKRLEERITLLQGQVLQGGADKEAAAAVAAQNLGPVQDTPAFRNAIKEHQERIRAEYESRLAELEKERETIEEEKAQVDRYKQLLLKQRDIMILLTQRLNERDEQIVALQDELDAYDRQQRDLEETLDEKTAALIHLQRVTMEHNAASPVKNTDLVEALGDWAAGAGAGGPAVSRGAPRIRRSDVAEASTAGDGATNRQYRPHAADVVASAAPATLHQHHLSADEKIAELSRLMDAARADRDRLSRELDDVRAEKVSMEYLLREKLEKLVQGEIEARLAAYKRDGDDASSAAAAAAAHARQLQAELHARGDELTAARADAAKAEDELRKLRRRVAESEGAAADSPAATAALRERLAVHQKERRAIHTIIENKIKTLVDGIAVAVGAPGSGGVPPPSPGSSGISPSQRLTREVQALQRLVNASVMALKNSEAGDAGSPDGASPDNTSPTLRPTASGPGSGASTVRPAGMPHAPPLVPSRLSLQGTGSQAATPASERRLR